MTATARLLPCGGRLHLQHGPIDLIIGADGPGDARPLAFRAASARFETVLDELVAELPLLRQPLLPGSPCPTGRIARAMEAATRPHADTFITPMAAVAGAVADEILSAMRKAAPLLRAYVNNGGDIALWLGHGQRYATAIQQHDGTDIGRIDIAAELGVGGIATSGRHGRSHSFGIADSVTVLAKTAAAADAAATLIANAIDLPGHPAIARRPANTLNPDSDLGERLVVTGCGPLAADEIARALDTGLRRARSLQAKGLIATALCLGSQIRVAGTPFLTAQRSLTDA